MQDKLDYKENSLISSGEMVLMQTANTDIKILKVGSDRKRESFLIQVVKEPT